MNVMMNGVVSSSLIGNACYSEGQDHPNLPHLECDSSKTPYSWSSKPIVPACSKGCLIDGICYLAGTKHPKIAGYECNPAKSKTSWTFNIEPACVGKGCP